jgi:hypothetical protein
LAGFAAASERTTTVLSHAGLGTTAPTDSGNAIAVVIVVVVIEFAAALASVVVVIHEVAAAATGSTRRSHRSVL